MLNLHHLELFYYVARHGGIMAACRHIPYGVQQPAVSAQMLRLEEDIGSALFRRRPFALTPAGQRLYDYLAPFFGNLPALEAEMKGAARAQLRLAGLSEVMREHAPRLLARLKRRWPDLRLSVAEADQKLAEQLILRGDADVAITVIDEALPAGLTCKRLLRLPLALLVPSEASWTSAAPLLKAGAEGRVELVSLGAHELLPRLFTRGLKAQGRSWPTTIEVSSAELVASYVAAGLGVGLTVSTPHRPPPTGLREILLPRFPVLTVGAFWCGRLSPVAEELLAALETAAKG